MRAAVLALLAILSIPRAGFGEDVTVFAAASLADALEEIARGCEQASGNKVVLNVGASSDLSRQIQAGAAADLFFSCAAPIASSCSPTCWWWSFRQPPRAGSPPLPI